jgi:DNA-binding GntR family transcriptional regulator
MAAEHDGDRRHVSDALRDAILRGEFLPGERLVEAHLMTRFGASRFTVRAALQDLTAEGLVETERNRGAHVRKVSLDEAVEITEVRMVVEGLIAARAAERIDAGRIDAGRASELEEIGLLMRRAVESGEPRRYHELNGRLHALIREIAGHRTADRIVGTLRGQLVRHQFVLSLLPGRPQQSLPQHERVIAAIRDGDPKLAEETMREHIASVIEALRSIDRLGGPA